MPSNKVVFFFFFKTKIRLGSTRGELSIKRKSERKYEIASTQISFVLFITDSAAVMQ